MQTPSTPKRRTKGCANCGKPAVPPFTPFCSAGCRDRDLLRWLGEGYRVPGQPADLEEEGFGADRLDSEP